MDMHCNHGVQRVNMLSNFGGLLMVYLKPCEIYQLFINLLQINGKIKNNPKKKNLLRWHIPSDELDQGQIISAFLDTYNTYANKTQRTQMMKHFYDKDISFDMILHSLFNTLCQSVLTLEESWHILTNFMLEGQKLLFRMIFSLIKMNHSFLVKVESQAHIMYGFQQNCLKVVPFNLLCKEAFEL